MRIVLYYLNYIYGPQDSGSSDKGFKIGKHIPPKSGVSRSTQEGRWIKARFNLDIGSDVRLRRGRGLGRSALCSGPWIIYPLEAFAINSSDRRIADALKEYFAAFDH